MEIDRKRYFKLSIPYRHATLVNAAKELADVCQHFAYSSTFHIAGRREAVDEGYLRHLVDELHTAASELISDALALREINSETERRNDGSARRAKQEPQGCAPKASQPQDPNR